MAIDALVCGSTIGDGSSSGSDSRIYPGESVVGETAAGSGYSLAGNTSSSGSINSGSSGITGGPSTLGDPMSNKSSNGLDTSVYVTVESSESDMTKYENQK
ncbi:hypothetical protein Tco_1046477 [Tanacetum coccineum]